MGYVRVSSPTQKDDLERQRQLVAYYAKERGWRVYGDRGSRSLEFWLWGGTTEKIAWIVRSLLEMIQLEELGLVWL